MVKVHRFRPEYTITDATNADPIVVTVNSGGVDKIDDLQNGDVIDITGVGGNDAANRKNVRIANVNPTLGTFELEGIAGDGAYTSGGVFTLERKVELFTASNDIGGVEFSTSDALWGTGTFMGLAENVPAVTTNEVDIKLLGKWDQLDQWHTIKVLTEADTWQQWVADGRFYTRVDSVDVRPFMRIDLQANAGANSQSGIFFYA